MKREFVTEKMSDAGKIVEMPVLLDLRMITEVMPYVTPYEPVDMSRCIVVTAQGNKHILKIAYKEMKLLADGFEHLEN